MLKNNRVLGLFTLGIVSILVSCVENRRQKSTLSEPPTCIYSAQQLPSDWRPSLSGHSKLDPTPWRDDEEQLRQHAVEGALEEMIDFQQAHPETIAELWDNSVEAYIDVAYAGIPETPLTERALDFANRHLEILWKPLKLVTKNGNGCHEASTTLTLLVYANNLRLRRPNHKGLMQTQAELLSATNENLNSCASLDDLIGYAYRDVLSRESPKVDEIYDLVMWSILILDGLAIDGLDLPEGSRELVSALWVFLGNQKVPRARLYDGGANHHEFYDLAYLYTHIGYMPTGYGRYPLKRSQGEWLYQFVRVNFYSVMEMGELDLFAEFVDLLRQYGCNERNDRQVLDGTRYLLSLYEGAERRWMNHREPYETKASNAYDLMHKPWTSMAGLRDRLFESCQPRSYCHYVHRLIEGK